MPRSRVNISASPASLMPDEWVVSFEVAGVFLQSRDIELSPRILVKSSQEEEMIFDRQEPVHTVLVRLTDNEFSKSDEYDMSKFGTNRFAQEAEFGVAEKLLTSAVSYYSIKTGYPTAILRKGTAINITLSRGARNEVPPWRQFQKWELTQDDYTRLESKTSEVRKEFPMFEEIAIRNAFVDLASRYYWMARSSHQDHVSFLNQVISLEVLFLNKNERSWKVRHRAATILSNNYEEYLEAVRKLGEVYETRHGIVHRGEDEIDYDDLNFLEKSIPRIIEGVSQLLRKLGDGKVTLCKVLDNEYTGLDLGQKGSQNGG